MATTFKTFLNDDVASTRTLLHEAIPVTGSILFGTYDESDANETNIKSYTHGMFQSVYDYTYTKSSANHILDLTVGYSSENVSAGFTTSGDTYKVKKQMIYNEFAKILQGHKPDGSIRQFDEDGNLADVGDDKIKECIVISIARLLNKDEIKKGSFYLDLDVSSTMPTTTGTCAVGGWDNAVKASVTIEGLGPSSSGLDDDNGTTLIVTNTDGTTVTFETDSSKTHLESVWDSGNSKALIGTSDADSPAKATKSLWLAFDAAKTAGALKATLDPTTYTSETSFTVPQTVAGSAGNRTFTGTIDTASLNIGGSAYSTGVSTFANGSNGTRSELRISDSSLSTHTNSPAGEYGILIFT